MLARSRGEPLPGMAGTTGPMGVAMPATHVMGASSNTFGYTADPATVDPASRWGSGAAVMAKQDPSGMGTSSTATGSSPAMMGSGSTMGTTTYDPSGATVYNTSGTYPSGATGMSATGSTAACDHCESECKECTHTTTCTCSNKKCKVKSPIGPVTCQCGLMSTTCRCGPNCACGPCICECKQPFN